MKNLAFNKECDVHIHEELTRAGIRVFVGDRRAGTVCSTIVGQLGCFLFLRLEDCVVAHGPMPLAVEEAMCATGVGRRDVRRTSPPLVISDYRIKSVEGLALFVETLKENALV